MLNMYLLPWRNAIHQTDFFVVEVTAFTKQSCLLGEMFYGFYEFVSEMFEVQSSMITKYDLKMIWWIALFLQNFADLLILTYYFQNIT